MALKPAGASPARMTVASKSVDVLTTTADVVTFDQNGQNAVSAEFGILAASLPNWRFRTDKDVI